MHGPQYTEIPYRSEPYSFLCSNFETIEIQCMNLRIQHVWLMAPN